MADRCWLPGRRRTDRVMALLWAGFTIAFLAFFYVFRDASEIADAQLDGYLEVMLLGVPTVVLLGASLWLRDSSADRDLRPRIVGWTVGMAMLFAAAIHAALFVIEPRFDTGEQWLLLLLSVGIGASSGSVMGVLDVGSKQRERERNRSVRLARPTERERSQLEHLNHYLRHEVLNEVHKITGYADVLSERADVSPENAAYLDTIRQSGTEIAVFIDSIRTILETSDHQPELAAVDVVRTLESEVKNTSRTYSSAVVDLDAPDSAYVLGGDLINRVFRNLIANAVEHNPGDVSLTISVEGTEDWVVVRVRDDGAGIPEADRDGLFEPPESGDHGYGLFLTRNLVEVYGGRLDLAESGPDGTEFVVRFQPAAPERTAAPSVAPTQTG